MSVLPSILAPKGITMSLRQMPSSDAETRGRWLVYKTSVWQGLKENGSLYFFSANTSSVEQSCLTVESLSLAPSCISAAIRRRLPLTSAISGLMFLRQPTVRVSAEMLPLYRPSTREMAFQKVDLPDRKST